MPDNFEKPAFESGFTASPPEVPKVDNILVHAEVDLKAICETIRTIDDINDNEEVFRRLAFIDELKQELKAAAENLGAVESAAKQAINDRAKVLYGTDWNAIKGNGYKISRSATGAVYEITDQDNYDPEFVETVIKPNTDKIDKFREAHNKLPEGIGRNEARGESIRITVKK